ncbi:MAG: HPr(Ser) kinase/phosphatase [bacterium]|nr:HPr(Ser) kinase/phosphatase [bacterium]
MKTPISVSVNKILREFSSIESVWLPDDPKNIYVSSVEINRPGLQFSGYYEYYDNRRIQIIGKSEESFLDQFSQEQYKQVIEDFFKTEPVLVVFSRGLDISDIIINAAKKYNVPILRTPDSTSSFTAALIAFLNVQLAPRITNHGVLVEVYGEGILILGESGVGKSETAIELVKRGHRLIADDAVELRRVSSRSIVGSSPENIRHFIELRGIGIINARSIFGMGAVKLTSKIDLVINLEPWEAGKVYDRMGLENQYTDILGLSIPSSTIPVKPGRNLAVIIEVAAMNNRQKKMGFNAANELLEKLGLAQPKDKKSEDFEWDIFE